MAQHGGRTSPSERVRNQLSPHVRNLIFKRDNKTCGFCGSTDSPTIDHILPIAAGGTNDPDNLRVLCWTCNNERGHVQVETRVAVLAGAGGLVALEGLRRVAKAGIFDEVGGEYLPCTYRGFRYKETDLYLINVRRPAPFDHALTYYVGSEHLWALGHDYGEQVWLRLHQWLKRKTSGYKRPYAGDKLAWAACTYPTWTVCPHACGRAKVCAAWRYGGASADGARPHARPRTGGT